MSSARPIEPLQEGCSFGRYRLDARLARGGMGEVWLATAHGPADFKKRVAIKTVLPGLDEKPGYVEMLIKEASLAARLNHPNIVQTFDLGCIDGVYYIAMEYLAGCSLANILRRTYERGERIPVGVLLQVAAAACDGLKYAHAYADDDGRPIGLLHRDVSPSNIMITTEGRVALLDFGVATAQAERFATNSGAIKGKFHYLPPERVRGQPGDRRSDLYSLGVVLYQCLTYRWPFRAESEYELLRQIAHELPPPPRQHAPWLSVDMERIVMRAMARDPDARYPDAGAMADELRAHQRTVGVAGDVRGLQSYLLRLFPELADRNVDPGPDAPGLEALGLEERGPPMAAPARPRTAFSRRPPRASRPPVEPRADDEVAERPSAARVRVPPPVGGASGVVRSARGSTPRAPVERIARDRADTAQAAPPAEAAAREPAVEPAIASAAPAEEPRRGGGRTARGSAMPRVRSATAAPTDAFAPDAAPRRPATEAAWFATGSDAALPQSADIFPEPTRITAAPVAVADVFGARPGGRRRRITGPAFYVGRSGAEAWPWATGVTGDSRDEAPRSDDGGPEDTG